MAATKRVTTLELNLTSRTAKTFMQDLAKQADNTRIEIAKMQSELQKAKEIGNQRVATDTDESYKKRLEILAQMPEKIKMAQNQMKVFETLIGGATRNVNALAEMLDTKGQMSLKRMQQAAAELQKKMQGMGKAEDMSKYMELQARYSATMRDMRQHMEEVRGGFQNAMKELRTGLDGAQKPLREIPGLIDVMKAQFQSIPRVINELSKSENSIAKIFNNATVNGSLEQLKIKIKDAMKFVPQGTTDYNILKAALTDIDSQIERIKNKQLSYGQASARVASEMGKSWNEAKKIIRELNTTTDQAQKSQLQGKLDQMIHKLTTEGKEAVVQFKELDKEIINMGKASSLEYSVEQQHALTKAIQNNRKEAEEYGKLMAQVMNGTLTGKDAPRVLEAIFNQGKTLIQAQNEDINAFKKRTQDLSKNFDAVVQSMSSMGMPLDRAREGVMRLTAMVKNMEGEERVAAEQLIADLNRYVQSVEQASVKTRASRIVGGIYGGNAEAKALDEARTAQLQQQQKYFDKEYETEQALLQLETQRKAEQEQMTQFTQKETELKSKLTAARQTSATVGAPVDLTKQKADVDSLKQSTASLYGQMSAEQTKMQNAEQQINTINGQIIAKKERIAQLERQIGEATSNTAKAATPEIEAINKQIELLKEKNRLVMEEKKSTHANKDYQDLLNTGIMKERNDLQIKLSLYKELESTYNRHLRIINEIHSKESSLLATEKDRRGILDKTLIAAPVNTALNSISRMPNTIDKVAGKNMSFEAKEMFRRISESVSDGYKELLRGAFDKGNKELTVSIGRQVVAAQTAIKESFGKFKEAISAGSVQEQKMAFRDLTNEMKISFLEMLKFKQANPVDGVKIWASETELLTRMQTLLSSVLSGVSEQIKKLTPQLDEMDNKIIAGSKAAEQETQRWGELNQQYTRNQMQINKLVEDKKKLENETKQESSDTSSLTTELNKEKTAAENLDTELQKQTNIYNTAKTAVANLRQQWEQSKTSLAALETAYQKNREAQSARTKAAKDEAKAQEELNKFQAKRPATMSDADYAARKRQLEENLQYAKMEVEEADQLVQKRKTELQQAQQNASQRKADMSAIRALNDDELKIAREQTAEELKRLKTESDIRTLTTEERSQMEFMRNVYIDLTTEGMRRQKGLTEENAIASQILEKENRIAAMKANEPRRADIMNNLDAASTNDIKWAIEQTKLLRDEQIQGGQEWVNYHNQIAAANEVLNAYVNSEKAVQEQQRQAEMEAKKLSESRRQAVEQEYSRSVTMANLETSSKTAIQEALQQTIKLRDASQQGSAEWKKYSAEVDAADAQLKKIEQNGALGQIRRFMEGANFDSFERIRTSLQTTEQELVTAKSRFQELGDAIAQLKDQREQLNAAMERHIQGDPQLQQMQKKYGSMSPQAMGREDELQRQFMQTSKGMDLQHNYDTLNQVTAQYETQKQKVQQLEQEVQRYTTSLQSMRGQYDGLKNISDTALQEVKKYWADLVANTDKSDAKLKEYTANLNAATKEEERRKELAKQDATAKQIEMMADKMAQLKNMSNSALKEMEQFWQKTIDGAKKGDTALDSYRDHLAAVQAQQKTNSMNNLGLQSINGQLSTTGKGMLQQLNDSAFPKTQEWLNKLKGEIETFKTKFAETPEAVKFLEQELAKCNQEMKTMTGEVYTEAETRKMATQVMKGDFQATTAEIDKMTRSFKFWQEQMKQKAGTSKIKEEVDKAAQSMEKFRRAGQQVSSVLNTDSMSATRLQEILSNPKSVKNLNEMQQALSIIQNRVRNNIDLAKQYGDQIRRLDKAYKESNKALGYHASTLEQAASRLKSYIMIYMGFNALMMKARQLVSSNLELSDSIANVQKVSGLAKEQVDKLSASLQNLQSRTNVMDLMKIAYQGSKMGVAVEGGRGALLQFTEAANKLNSALGEDFGGAEAIGKLTKLTQVMHLTGEANKDLNSALEKTGSSILMLGNSSTASYSYIQQFASRLGGIASTAKIAMPDLLAIGSTLDTMQMPAEMAATAMTKFIATLSKKPDQMAKTLQMTGDILSTFNSAIKSGDTMTAVTMVFKQLHDNKADLKDVANVLKDLVGGGNNTRALQVLTSMANGYDTLIDHIRISNEAFEDGTAISKEYEIMNETAAASMKRFGNAIMNIFVNSPVSNGFGKFAKGLADTFEYLQQNLHTLLAVLASIALHFMDFGLMFGRVRNAWANLTNDAIKNLQEIKVCYETEIKHGLFQNSEFQLKILGIKIKTWTGQAAHEMKLMSTKCQIAFQKVGAAITSVELKLKALSKSVFWFAILDMISEIILNLGKIPKIEKMINDAEVEVGKTILSMRQKWQTLYEAFAKAEKGTKEYMKLNNAFVTELEKFITKEELINMQIIDQKGNIIDLAKAYEVLTEQIIKSERAKTGESLVNEVDADRMRRQRNERKSMKAGIDQMIDVLPEEDKVNYNADDMINKFIEATNMATEANQKLDKKNRKTPEQIFQQVLYRTDAGAKFAELIENTNGKVNWKSGDLLDVVSMKYRQVKALLTDGKEAGKDVYRDYELKNNPALYMPGLMQRLVEQSNMDAEDIQLIYDTFGKRDFKIADLLDETDYNPTSGSKNGKGKGKSDVASRIVKARQDALKDAQEQTKSMFADFEAAAKEMYATGDIQLQTTIDRILNFMNRNQSRVLEGIDKYVLGKQNDNEIETVIPQSVIDLWKQQANGNKTLLSALDQLDVNRSEASTEALRARLGFVNNDYMGVGPGEGSGEGKKNEWVNPKELARLMKEAREDVEKQIAEAIRNQAKVDAERAKKIRDAIMEGNPLAKVKDDFVAMLDTLEIFFKNSTDWSEQAVQDRVDEIQSFSARITTVTFEQFQEMLATSRNYRDLDAAEQKVFYEKMLKYKEDYDEAARKMAARSIKLLDNRMDSGEYYREQLVTMKQYRSLLEDAGKTGTEAYISVARAIDVLEKKQNKLISGKMTSFAQRQKSRLESSKNRVQQEEATGKTGVNNNIQLGQAKLSQATIEFSMAIETYQVRQSEADRIIGSVLDKIAIAENELNAAGADNDKRQDALQKLGALQLELQAAEVRSTAIIADTYDKMLEAQKTVAEQEAEIQANRISNIKEYQNAFTESIRKFAIANEEAMQAKAFELAKIHAERTLGIASHTAKQRFLIIKQNGDAEEKWLNDEEATKTQIQIDAHNHRMEALQEGIKAFGEQITKTLRDAMTRSIELRKQRKQEEERQKMIRDVQNSSLNLQMNSERSFSSFLKSELDARLSYYHNFYEQLNDMSGNATPKVSAKAPVIQSYRQTGGNANTGKTATSTTTNNTTTNTTVVNNNTTVVQESKPKNGSEEKIKIKLNGRNVDIDFDKLDNLYDFALGLGAIVSNNDFTKLIGEYKVAEADIRAFVNGDMDISQLKGSASSEKMSTTNMKSVDIKERYTNIKDINNSGNQISTPVVASHPIAMMDSSKWGELFRDAFLQANFETTIFDAFANSSKEGIKAFADKEVWKTVGISTGMQMANAAASVLTQRLSEWLNKTRDVQMADHLQGNAGAGATKKDIKYLNESEDLLLDESIKNEKSKRKQTAKNLKDADESYGIGSKEYNEAYDADLKQQFAVDYAKQFKNTYSKMREELQNNTAAAQKEMKENLIALSVERKKKDATENTVKYAQDKYNESVNVYKQLANTPVQDGDVTKATMQALVGKYKDKQYSDGSYVYDALKFNNMTGKSDNANKPDITKFNVNDFVKIAKPDTTIEEKQLEVQQQIAQNTAETAAQAAASNGEKTEAQKSEEQKQANITAAKNGLGSDIVGDNDAQELRDRGLMNDELFKKSIEEVTSQVENFDQYAELSVKNPDELTADEKAALESQKAQLMLAVWQEYYDKLAQMQLDADSNLSEEDKKKNLEFINTKRLEVQTSIQAEKQKTDAQKKEEKKQLAATQMKEAATQSIAEAGAAASSAVGSAVTQATGSEALGQLTAGLAQTGASVVQGIAEGGSKTIGQLGWWGAALIPVITSTLMALLASATSKTKKAQSEISQVTGVSAGKLTTGMLTYATGKYNEEEKNGRVSGGMVAFADGYTPGQSYSVDGADGNTYNGQYVGNVSDLGTGIQKGTHFGIFSEVKPEMVIDGDTTKLMHEKYPMLENAILTLHRTGSLNMPEMLGLNYENIGRTIQTLTKSHALSFSGGGAGFRMPTFAEGNYPYDNSQFTIHNSQLTGGDVVEGSAGGNAQMQQLNDTLALLQATLQSGIGVNMWGKSGLNEAQKKAERFKQRNNIR